MFVSQRLSNPRETSYLLVQEKLTTKYLKKKCKWKSLSLFFSTMLDT